MQIAVWQKDHIIRVRIAACIEDDKLLNLKCQARRRMCRRLRCRKGKSKKEKGKRGKNEEVGRGRLVTRD